MPFSFVFVFVFFGDFLNLVSFTLNRDDLRNIMFPFSIFRFHHHPAQCFFFGLVGRCGELSKAKRILRAMEDSPGGSIAQTLTYNTIIKGLGRELLVDEAFEVARSMVDRGCSPNEVCIHVLFNTWRY